jgi:hypothetical protein
VDVLVAFVVGLFLASVVFGNAWWQEKGKRKAAEGLIVALKRDLGRVLGWRR